MKTTIPPSIKNDFPIFKRKIHGKPLVYLDSASSSQKPRQVIDTIKDYYEKTHANIHRGVYTLSEEATLAYEDAHRKVARFINAKFKEIIFTKNTTESINLLAYSLGLELKKGDEILLTEMEHHSNLVPWQQIAKRVGAAVKFMKVSQEGELVIDNKLFTPNTKIVAVTHISNVMGTINPIKEIIQKARSIGAKVVIDAAQSAPHIPIDVKELDADFLAFSSHKMLGPTGVGVLYGKQEFLEKMTPFLYGGDMIKEVKLEDTTFNDLPWKFEAGTPNIAGGIALGTAIDYLTNIGMHSIDQHEKELLQYAHEQLSKVKGITIYGPRDLKKKAGIIAFNFEDIHPHDVSSILDTEGIAIRGGHHCAMPLMKVLDIQASCRLSLYLYNTKEDIDVLVKALEKVRKVFK
ncbi:cysteine desulfurase [Candidatus Woesearchaeota archaeon]|nr:cysteine desulfurase [Candidatus Woesearchaeota archaeon]